MLMSFCLYCVGDFVRLRKRRDHFFLGGTIIRGGEGLVDGDIVFYIHGSTVEYGGTLFDAGELTTDILNLGPREYAPLHDQLQHILSLARQCESTQDRGVGS